MDWLTVAAAGFAGLGLGIGVVVGSFVVRLIRHFIDGDGP